MANIIWIDGVPHRKRRGEIVAIPEQWLGKTLSAQTKRKRNSKTRIKQIESQQDRAKEKCDLREGKEIENHRKRRVTYWPCRDRRDGYRDKFRRERQGSVPSNLTDTSEGSMP